MRRPPLWWQSRYGSLCTPLLANIRTILILHRLRILQARAIRSRRILNRRARLMKADRRRSIRTGRLNIRIKPGRLNIRAPRRSSLIAHRMPSGLSFNLRRGIHTLRGRERLLRLRSTTFQAEGSHILELRRSSMRRRDTLDHGLIRTRMCRCSSRSRCCAAIRVFASFRRASSSA
jgi:hypothetical protein